MTTTRQDLTLTVKARVNGFDVDICFSGQVEQLDAITKRLLQLGAEPAASAPANGGKKPAQRAQPFYDGDGQACCPVHRKPLSEGRYGLFCSAKAKPGEEQNDKGYCSLKFAE